MALLFFSTVDEPAPWRAALQRLAPDVEVRVFPDLGNPADIRYALVYRPPSGLLASLPNLQAIFSLAAGVEALLADPTLPPVPIARMVDPSLTATMADYVLAACLRAARDLDRYARAQASGRWEFRPPTPIGETTVGVLGLGQIGAAVANRLRATGFTVAGWSRRRRTLQGIETFAGNDGLRAMLPALDILVSLLPATAATRDLIDARLLAALKPGAHVVNVGRGDQIVDADLLDALDHGHLAGATLDVFRTEPLPADHAFWRHPRILLTPHVAGFPIPDTAAVAVAENLRRAAAGQPLHHVVDRELGY